MQEIRIKTTHPAAKLPARANEFATGYDVHPVRARLIDYQGNEWIVESEEEIAVACREMYTKSRMNPLRRLLYFLKDKPLQRGWKQAWFDTGLQAEPQDIDTYLSLEPCSRTVKTDYVFHNSLGTIDYDYRGNMWAIYHSVCETYAADSLLRLFNTCGQLKPKTRMNVQFVPADALSDTSRGAGGFGSTEKKA